MDPPAPWHPKRAGGLTGVAGWMAGTLAAAGPMGIGLRNSYASTSVVTDWANRLVYLAPAGGGALYVGRRVRGRTVAASVSERTGGAADRRGASR